ncbi:metalloregulator ArsR/SmtB family transcription factor [Actinoplanes sp. NPDC023936]|uniref:metalloregulator ArsR/SmtB family transcription factor n=1 Tax=Actinoplanes sp. NPDC023936 TaxID=3154910 RepID=UPI0033C7697C
MDALFAALADPVRWRLVGLLAERPRPVGVLAQLAGVRQPQTTKHLQTLERAGLVAAQRIGQRRIYSLRPEPLRELAARLGEMAEHVAAAPAGAHLDAERAAATGPGWADGRMFTFRRVLAATPATVWRHLTEAGLLARWWTPDDLRVSELIFEAWPGGRIVQEYRDADDTDGIDEIAGRAEGRVDEVRAGQLLAYQMSPMLPGGGIAFTAHVEFRLRAAAGGSELDVVYRVTGSTAGAADFIAGIEIGFGQSLDRLAATLRTEN